MDSHIISYPDMTSSKRNKNASAALSEKAKTFLKNLAADEPADGSRDEFAALRKDFDNLGRLANALFYRNGPSLAVVKTGMVDHPHPEESALAKIATRFARRVDTGLKKRMSEILSVMPETDQEIAIAANFHQADRRSFIFRTREAMAKEMWERATQIVKHSPVKAIEIVRQDAEMGKRAMLRAVALLMPSLDKGIDHFYAQGQNAATHITRQLKAAYTDPGQVDDDTLTLKAAEQWGGMPLLVTCAIACSMVAACAPLIETALTCVPNDLEHYAIDGRLPIVAEDVAALDFWGSYGYLARQLARTRINEWMDIAAGVALANVLTTDIHTNWKEIQQQFNRTIRNAERDTQRLSKRLQDTEIQLVAARRALENARTAKAAPNPGAASPDQTVTDESTQLRRTIERQRQELEEKSATLDGVQELLDAILSDPAPAAPTPSALTSKEAKQLRGVVIGGHQNFLNKLRKILPNCTFYSADQKRIDDANLQKSQFVIFNTGYCNHALADNALRVCRRHDIPTGYSTHVNPDRFLQDVAKIIGRGE